MTIQELMEKRAKVWEAAKNFVDTHENENGVMQAVRANQRQDVLLMNTAGQC